MINIVTGIITILICIIGFLFAYFSFKTNKFITSLVLISGCGLLLRVYVGTDKYLHQWDERYHALISKNIMNHPLKPTLYDNPVLPYDYRNWWGNHIWLHKQPFPLWLMALSMWIFGINEIALRLPSIIISTLGIWFMYSIATYFFDKKVGILSAFLYSIHGLIIEVTGGRVATDHIDVFFLVFIQMGVFFCIKFIEAKNVFYNIIAGIAIGCAILSKWLPALIVLPIWVLLILDSKKFTTIEILKHFVILCLFCILTFLPWQIYIYYKFPLEARWESAYNLRHITEVLDERGGAFYYHFNNVRIIFGEIIYIPLVWFLWKTFKKIRNFKRLAICIWFLAPFIFFSIVKTKMQAYTLFAAPAIFIITSIFWWYLHGYRKNIKFRWLTYSILILIIALPVRYSIERIKPFNNMERTRDWANKLRSLNEKLIGRNVIIFNLEYPIEAMFYSDCVAYSHVPPSNQIEYLISSGYKVIINDSGSLDSKIKSIKGIKILKII